VPQLVKNMRDMGKTFKGFVKERGYGEKELEGLESVNLGGLGNVTGREL